jgi:hypothetical protein
MSGENNGTTFTDLSPSPKTITRYGDTKTVTAQSKYYGSSGYFDGAGDYLAVDHNSDLSFGAGDYTVELWARFDYASQLVDFPQLVNKGNGNSTLGAWEFFARKSNGTLTFRSNGATTDDITFPAVTDTGWHHYAISRSGTTLRGFFDGGLIGTKTAAANLNETSPVLLGSRLTAYYLGHLQDVRLTGAARYTANFTPPSRLLGVVSGIVTDRSGNPCQRKVYAVSRPTDTAAPVVIAHSLSDPTTGSYELVISSGEEVTRIVVSEDDDPLRNDIADRVIPE